MKNVLEIEGSRGGGGPKLSWKGMTKKNRHKVGLAFEDTKNPVKWRNHTK